MMPIIGTLFPLFLLIPHNNIYCGYSEIGMVYLTLDTQAFNACIKQNLAAVLEKILLLKGV